MNMHTLQHSVTFLANKYYLRTYYHNPMVQLRDTTMEKTYCTTLEQFYRLMYEV